MSAAHGFPFCQTAAVCPHVSSVAFMIFLQQRIHSKLPSQQKFLLQTEEEICSVHTLNVLL